MLGAFPGIAPQWQQIVVFLSLASMLLGAFAAIGQTNIKRLMAYSSIANVGFALVGLAAALGGRHPGRADLHGDLSGHDARHLRLHPRDAARRAARSKTSTSSPASRRHNLPMAFALAMLMFSLAGIPPLAGFWSKWYVFLAAVKRQHVVLAVIGVLASVVGAYYYLRIVKVMFFDEAAEPFLPVRDQDPAVMAFSGLFVLLFSLPFIGGPIVAAATAAAKTRSGIDDVACITPLATPCPEARRGRFDQR